MSRCALPLCEKAPILVTVYAGLGLFSVFRPVAAGLRSWLELAGPLHPWQHILTLNHRNHRDVRSFSTAPLFSANADTSTCSLQCWGFGVRRRRRVIGFLGCAVVMIYSMYYYFVSYTILSPAILLFSHLSSLRGVRVWAKGDISTTEKG